MPLLRTAKAGVYRTNEYAVGREACRRVGASWVVPGCAPCNAAMNRPRHHAHVVFRMRGHAGRPAADQMERRSDSEKKSLPTAQRETNEMQKLLQQLTFYFCETDDGRWVTRTDEDIKLCAFMHRMAANLVLWGEERNFRHLAIAIFYASLYVRDRLSAALTPERWHMHNFQVCSRFSCGSPRLPPLYSHVVLCRLRKQELYQNTYERSTFFGIHLQEAASTFSIREPRDATNWQSILLDTIEPFVSLALDPPVPLPDAMQVLNSFPKATFH